jgi:hypothetical protein
MYRGARTEEEGQYAWPEIKGEASPGAMKVEWGPSCPKCVAERNAHYSNGRWRGLRDDPPRGWKNYVVPGVVEFMGPAGLVDSVAVDSCTLRGSWTAKNLRIVIRRVLPLQEVFVMGTHVMPKADYDYMALDAIGDCIAAISVTEKRESVCLSASLASTTSTIDNLDISVVATGKKASEIARAILGTIVFPGKKTGP